MKHILDALQATPNEIRVGRVPAVGRSASLAVATRQAEDLAVHPKYYAETDHREMLVSRAELDALVEAGAQLDGVRAGAAIY